VEENSYAGGWGADIAAEVSGRLFGELAAPVLRVTCPDVPVPFQRDLERGWSPGPEDVGAQVAALLATGRLPEPWWAA